MDRWSLRTWELHRLHRLDMSWRRNDYRRRLELHTLEILLLSIANFKCGGGMWVPRSKFLSQSISCFGIHVSCCILLHKKIKKWEELLWWQVFHQRNTTVSTLNVLLLTLNKALLRGRPRITRFVLMFTSVRIKFNHASCFPLSVLVCSSLNVCPEIHS